MHNQENEIITILAIGSTIAWVLVVFIVTMIYLYQKRQKRFKKEVERIIEEYNKELLKSQLEIQEKTVKKISQDLHDNVGQLLSVIKLTVGGAANLVNKSSTEYDMLSSTIPILTRAIDEVSHLTKSLHTDRIVEVGLEDAIKYEIETVNKAKLLHVDFTSEDAFTKKSLSKENTVFLFRIFQELLNNILKHANATYINVTIKYKEKKNFILIVKDNGIGFDVEAMKKNTNSAAGVGLRSMTNRAKLIGAKLVINSAINDGTEVKITLPLDEDRKLFEEQSK